MLPCGDIMGWSPSSMGGSQWAGVGRKKGKVELGSFTASREAFESGHTCLSCERPYSPRLAGIPEQRQRESERDTHRV